MFKPQYASPEINKDTWNQERKKYLTGSDIAKLMNYIVNGEVNTYGGSIYKFTHDKINPPVPNAFQKAKFRVGHLEEASAIIELKNDAKERYGVDNVDHLFKSHGGYIKDFIRVTLDLEEYFRHDYGTDVHEGIMIHEIKTTSSEDMYLKYESEVHMSFYQACAQLYCHEAAEMLYIHVIPVDGLHGKYPKVACCITRQSECYLRFIKELPLLKQIYEAYLKGEEFFVKEPSKRAVPEYISLAAIEINDLNERIADLELLKKEKEKIIIDYAADNGIASFVASNSISSDRDLEVRIINSSANVVDEKYREEYKRVFAEYRAQCNRYFLGKYVDLYCKKNSVYVNIKYKK